MSMSWKYRGYYLTLGDDSGIYYVGKIADHRVVLSPKRSEAMVFSTYEAALDVMARLPRFSTDWTMNGTEPL